MIEKILQKDVLLKIAAIVIALLVWANVYPRENPVGTKVVNAELSIQLPEPKILKEQPPARVALTFEGRERSLDKVRAEDIKVLLDLSNAPVGKTTLPIEYDSPYPELKVIDINPPTLTVDVTTLEDKVVGIVVKVKGAPNKEFTAGSPVYSAEIVKVTGPRSNVERVQQVLGQIDVTGAVASTSGKVALVPYDAYGNEVAQIVVEPTEIDVTVPLDKKDPATMIAVKVETTGTPKKGYKLAGVTVSPEQVEIRGTASATAHISALTARVSVDSRDAAFSQGVTLTAPSGVMFESTNRVTVNIAIEPDIISKTFSKVVVQLENLPIGFAWDMIPTQVDVTLSGRSDILEQVKASDVQAFINAASMDPQKLGPNGGEDDLWVYLADLPDGIEIDIRPQKVTLELTKR